MTTSWTRNGAKQKSRKALRALLLTVSLVVALGLGGCDWLDTNDDPNYDAIIKNSLRLATKTCASHEGIGYLNLDTVGYIDELRCKDGARRER